MLFANATFIILCRLRANYEIMLYNNEDYFGQWWKKKAFLRPALHIEQHTELHHQNRAEKSRNNQSRDVCQGAAEEGEITLAWNFIRSTAATSICRAHREERKKSPLSSRNLLSPGFYFLMFFLSFSFKLITWTTACTILGGPRAPTRRHIVSLWKYRCLECYKHWG